MRRLKLGLVLLLLFTSAAAAQESNGLKTVEFVSPIVAHGKFDHGPHVRTCFSFVTESSVCSKSSDLYYGHIRSGEDWDWFQAKGDGDRNRIKKLGRKDWTDELKIPVVEPYAALKEGERRTIYWDASGADGAPGLNADGTVASSDAFEFPKREREPRRKRAQSDYHPFEKAAAGAMYVMRVVDGRNDFYVLFRVEELERGRRCVISWKKIPAPAKD